MVIVLLLVLSLLLAVESPAQEQLAFPGAIGFGASSQGGRGGEILYVTNLQNDGHGSLRWALEEKQGARIVLFKVQGRINLTEEIRIESPLVTLAGQSAPGKGVVVSGARLLINTSHVIIRGMRFRPGDQYPGDIPRQRDCVSHGNNARHVVLDRNSCAWAVDESIAIWGSAEDITISNNIIAEALRDSIHVDEGASGTAPHSMGVLVGGGTPKRISLVRNLLTSNEYRNPAIYGASKIEFINNLVFNYGAAHQGIQLSSANSTLSAVIVSNVYLDGKDTNRGEIRPPFDLRSIDGNSLIYFADNSVQYHEAGSQTYGNTQFVLDRPPFEYSPGLPVVVSGRVEELLLESVGSRRGAAIDPVEERVIQGLGSDKLRVIDSPTDVGGFDVYHFTSQTIQDTDLDGLPDWFEEKFQHYGFRKYVADAHGDTNQNGYADVEDYLNGLLDGMPFQEYAPQTPKNLRIRP